MDQSGGAFIRYLNRALLPPELGAAYKQRHPATRWIRVKLYPAAAAAVCGNGETSAAEALPQAPFDARRFKACQYVLRARFERAPS